MNTWIQAVRMYNRDHPATRWIMPVKGGEPYKEVKALQAAEKPEAKRAKALTGLRKVEAETKARNEARAAEAANKIEASKKAKEQAKPPGPSPLLPKEKTLLPSRTMSSIPPEVAKGRIFTFDQTEKPSIRVLQYSPDEGTHTTVGVIKLIEDKSVTSSHNKLVYKGTLAHRETKGGTGTKSLMKFADIPQSAQEGLVKFLRTNDFKYSFPGSNTEAAQAEEPKAEEPKAEEPKAAAKVPETEPKNKYSFLKKMVNLPTPNLAELLGVELTAAQKKQLAAVEKLFDSSTMPDRLFVGDDLDCGMSANEMVKGVLTSMLVQNIAEKYKLGQGDIYINDFFYESHRYHTVHSDKLRAAVSATLKKMGKEIPQPFEVVQ